MNHLEKAELLAPAGSFAAMTAAYKAGADAVYIGGRKFSARAYADNLSEELLREAIEYAHLREKKLYLTVNTMLKEDELQKELFSYLAPLYEDGLDAVIVQDYGVFRAVRTWFPDLSIHCSTQMTITGAQSAQMFQELGAKRVVTARELSLDELKEIRQATSLEIESFVHGALCYCYSGQCLLSSMIGQRSGNRGKCAQPCRLPYEVLENGNTLNDRTSRFVLSPKDMCTIDLLPEIISAGVYSLKIEGRMKKPEYTAGVVAVYRKYLDQVLEGTFCGVSEKDHRILFDLYNRDGFHQGYYKQRNGAGMIALENKKSEKKGAAAARNETLFQELRENYINVKDPISLSLHATFRENESSILTLQAAGETLTCQGAIPTAAQKQPLTRERIRQQLSKLGTTPFIVCCSDIELSGDLFLPMQALNELRREGICRLTDQILQRHRRSQAKRASISSEIGDYNGKPRLSVSVETPEQIHIVLNEPDIDRIYVGSSIFDTALIQECQSRHKEIYVCLPRILRSRELPYVRKLIDRAVTGGVSGFEVFTPEMYAFLRTYVPTANIVLGASVSGWNSAAQQQLIELGIEGDVVPYELNYAEIRQRQNKLSELTVYGYLPLMISAQCIVKTIDRCRRTNSKIFLKDRKQTMFPVCSDCQNCYNIVYNCVPLALFGEMEAVLKTGVRGYRLAFTMEDQRQTAEILALFRKARKKEHIPNNSFVYTKGHFRRGV